MAVPSYSAEPIERSWYKNMINKSYADLLQTVPEPECEVDWDAVSRTATGEFLSLMENTQQNPEYHSEGNVLNHTKMVVANLVSDAEYWEMSKRDRTVLYLAALLHDIGKIRCTRLIDGKLSSPNHAKRGSVMARAFLWKTLGMSGNDDLRSIREAVSMLIRYHSFPPFAIKDENPELKLLKIASLSELTKDFSVRKLCLLERADAMGRVGSGTQDYLERTEYCRMLAEDLGVLDSQYEFADDFTKRSYFLKKSAWRDDKIYNSSFGEVVLMSGLAGTGKDTWIEKNLCGMPIISLDDIREEFGISPTGNQGEVARIAHERSKVYLRAKQPFVFNATSITSDIRGMQIALFEQYGASVRTVFLETEWNENLRRNAERKRNVPEHAIEKMLSKLEIPERFESEKVDWICV